LTEAFEGREYPCPAGTSVKARPQQRNRSTIPADFFSSIRYSRIASNHTPRARAVATDFIARVAANNISVLKISDLKFLKTATLR
jgi:hypothetical protein